MTIKIEAHNSFKSIFELSDSLFQHEEPSQQFRDLKTLRGTYDLCKNTNVYFEEITEGFNILDSLQDKNIYTVQIIHDSVNFTKKFLELYITELERTQVEKRDSCINKELALLKTGLATCEEHLLSIEALIRESPTDSLRVEHARLENEYTNTLSKREELEIIRAGFMPTIRILAPPKIVRMVQQ
jgi:hypothetical protein